MEMGSNWQTWWNDGRRDLWLEKVVSLFSRGPGVRGLLDVRLLLFVVRGWLAARDFGIPNFLGLICVAMDSFTAKFWACFLRDNTSPKLPLVGLSVDILSRGLGPVGCTHIPLSIWRQLVPPSFFATSWGIFSRLRLTSEEGNIMARALIGQGVLTPIRDPDLGPNGSFFPVPKNRENASFIVNLVAFNESMRSKCHLYKYPL